MLRLLGTIWHRFSNGRSVGRDESDEVDPSPSSSDEDPSSYAEIAELLETVRKLTRSQTKLALKLEDLAATQDGGFADLRATLTARAPSSTNGARCDDVLDALDALDEAARALDAGRTEGVAEGLHAVAARLTRFLAEQSLARVVQAAVPIDGRLFRVVGTERHAGLPDGMPVRIVRAAVRRGDRVVREGEVIVNRMEEE